MSFDVQNSVLVGVVYGWQHWYEAFCVPALSSVGTVFVLSEKTDAVHELFERASPAEFNGALNRQGGELR